MVFAAAADGDDLDPFAQTASLRTSTLRRYLAWYPRLKQKAEHLLKVYLAQKEEDDKVETQQKSRKKEEKDEEAETEDMP
jgi:hypothetical protein